MPEGTRLLTFSLLATGLILLPGPSVLFIVTRSLSFGRRAALTTVLGNAAGEYAQVLAVAFGLGLLVERSLLALSLIRLAGAAYLVWLGVRTFRGRHRLAGELGGAAPARTWGRVFRDGVVVGASNPKTMVFFAAVLPQFLDPARGDVPVQLLCLGLVWTAIALVSDSCWGLLASRAGGWLRRSPQRRSAVAGVSGLVTAGLGVGLAVSGARS